MNPVLIKPIFISVIAFSNFDANVLDAEIKTFLPTHYRYELKFAICKAQKLFLRFANLS